MPKREAIIPDLGLIDRGQLAMTHQNPAFHDQIAYIIGPGGIDQRRINTTEGDLIYRVHLQHNNICALAHLL